ncbi:hypothetical protein [Methylorubrum extorquens]|uniref:hypothetical protein n=1 Tax=Methylorubrum extorquens TaxID=408 RepID=UPI0018728D87|nr:hypothetical protein [Methylorubrum extorquens]
MTGKKMVRLCLTSDANGNNHGIAVLSDNNPLARCPVSNVRHDGSKPTFGIACEGKNSAHASAAPDGVDLLQRPHRHADGWQEHDHGRGLSRPPDRGLRRRQGWLSLSRQANQTVKAAAAGGA